MSEYIKLKTPVIGILVLNEVHIKFYDYCASVAALLDCEIFYFTGSNIKNNIIFGKTFESGKWKRKQYSISNEVDVIYDRLRAHEHKQYSDIYTKLKDIPFTHPNYGKKLNKLELYDQLLKVETLKKYIIPYTHYSSSDDFLIKLEKWKKIILKPKGGSGGENLYYIELLENEIEIVYENKKEILTPTALSNWLEKLPKIENYVVQKYINSRTLDGNPFDIRIHLGKDLNNKWSFINIFPRIGYDFEKISLVNRGGYISKWKGFIKRNFPDENFIDINKEIKKFSLESIEVFEKINKKKLTEVAIDVVISEDFRIYLLEMNVNKPGGALHEYDLAYQGISYASYVARNSDKTDYLSI